MVWDYESGKFIGTCSNQLIEVAGLAFLEPYAVLLSVDISSEIVMWELLWSKTGSFIYY